MRVFIAIALEDELKGYLGEKQESVRECSVKGNFTRLENLHLTLRFIGEASSQEIEGIKKAIDMAAERIKSFQMTLGALGEFPRGNKKILWVGIHQGQSSLQQLFNQLEECLEKQGYAREEKGLKPHITLGREIMLKKPFDELKKEIILEEKYIHVNEIVLMESTRVQGALTYVPIYRKYLQGSNV